MQYGRHNALFLGFLLAILLSGTRRVNASRLSLAHEDIHRALAPFTIDVEHANMESRLWKGKNKEHPVAIKAFPKSSSGGKLLDRQASILASLDHPNIIKYISSIKSDSGPYDFLVTEWAVGHTLQSMVPIRDISKLALIIAQIMSTIHYLHSKKIALGDLKAEDIIISDTLAVSLVNISAAKKDSPSIPVFANSSAGCLLDDYKSLARLIHYAYKGKIPKSGDSLLVDSNRLNKLIQALSSGADPHQLWHNCYERFAGFARFRLFKDVANLPSLFQYRPFDVDPKKWIPQFEEETSAIHMQELKIISSENTRFWIGKYRDELCIINWMPVSREEDRTRLIRAVNFLVAFGGMDPVPEFMGIVTDDLNKSRGMVMRVPAGDFYSPSKHPYVGAMGSILTGLHLLHHNSIAYLSLHPQSIWITAEVDQIESRAILLDYSLVETDASPTYGIRTPIIGSDQTSVFINDVARFGTQPYYSYGMAVDYYALSVMLPVAKGHTDLTSILADPDHSERWKYCYTDYAALSSHPYFQNSDAIQLIIN